MSAQKEEAWKLISIWFICCGIKCRSSCFAFFPLKTNWSNILLSGQNWIIMLERVQFIDSLCRKLFQIVWWIADGRFLGESKKKIQLPSSRSQEQVKNATLGAALLFLLFIWLIWKRIIVHQMNKSLLWKMPFVIIVAVLRRTQPHDTGIYLSNLAVLCVQATWFDAAFSSRLSKKKNKPTNPG